MCLYPKEIKNRKYTPNKKNKGIIPEIKDNRARYVQVGCGRCIECTKQRARSWQVRLLEEIKQDSKAKFITLTFSDEAIKELNEQTKNLEGYAKDNEIAKKSIRRFLERYRKKNKVSAKHWIITEIGKNGTENIHMHGIIWTNETDEEINRLWSYGYTWIGNYVNEKTVNYIIKYITKIDKDHKYYKPKILTSKGIGKEYLNSHNAKLNEYKEEKTNETYRTRSGHKIALPLYYRNKIYEEDQKEKLWMYKLDKETRYILKQKIEVKTKEQVEEFIKIREQYRKRNDELGYGNDNSNKEEIEQEKKQRNKLREERIKKASGGVLKGLD